MTVPYSEAPPLYQQMSVFDFLGVVETSELVAVPCKIFDWRANTSIEFKSMRNGG